MKKYPLSLLATSIMLSTTAYAAVPGTPTINWGEHTYALVELDRDKPAYNQIVVGIHDEVTVNVEWTVHSGDPAETAAVLIDGEPAWTGNGSVNKASFAMSDGGIYDMAIQLCNSEGCSTSNSVELTIADTDGSHLEPLVPPMLENNKPYTNTTGSVVGTYFVEWGVYDRNFPVDKVPAQNITHILYGFTPICGGDGLNDSLKQIPGSFQALQKSCAGREDFKVSIHDPWAAIQKGQQGVNDWQDPYRGNFGQLMALKQAYPDLKILPSIGGWTLSDPFYFMHDENNRRTFVSSVKEYLQTWKFFDGVDIDWEYPGGDGANPELGDKERDGALYVTLMKELRAMLDELSAETGRTYELTSAIGVAEQKIEVVDYSQAQQYMDYIFLMNYDMFGAFDLNTLGHQSGLYDASHNPAINFTTDRGVQTLLAQGLDPEKLVIGVTKYGRGWSGVHDYTGDNPMSGKATGPIAGTWEPGVIDYREIVNQHSGEGWETRYDEQAEASYKWNPQTKEMITYDNERAIKAKGKYVRDHGFAGLFSWEVDADNGDVLNAMHEALGHGDDDGGNPPENKPPVANAGVDKTVSGPADVILDGSNSYDPEQDSLGYQWKQTSGDAIFIENPTNAKASINVPSVDEETSYTFTLTVTESEGLTDSDSVTITNQPEQENQPPTVSLPDSLVVDSADVFKVTAKAEDPDNDPLTYTWTTPDNFEVIAGEGTTAITLKAPNVEEQEQATVSILVSDGSYDATATTIITVNPVDDGGDGECDMTDPDADNYPAWQMNTVYNTGDKVSHDQLVWSAKYWTQNVAPSLGADEWSLVSNVEAGWNANIAYNGGDEVNHDGLRWRAKWWTEGDEPSMSSSVWEHIGDATCP